MNWSRAKTILIVLFSFVNLVLLTTYMYMEYRADNISDRTINSTVAVLSSKNMYINRELIQNEKYKDYCLNMSNLVHNPMNAVVRFLGEEYTRISGSEYRAKTKELIFYETRLIYNDKREWEPLREQSVSKETDKLCEKHLTGLGFDKNTYFMYNKKIENGILDFQIMPRFKEYKIEGVHLKIKADQYGVLSMEGCWFETDFFKSHPKEVFCDVTSVLLAYMYSEPNGKNIVGLEGCYYIPPEFAGAKEIAPMPVYIISCEDKSVSIFNAKDATLILKNEGTPG